MLSVRKKHTNVHWEAQEEKGREKHPRKRESAAANQRWSRSHKVQLKTTVVFWDTGKVLTSVFSVVLSHAGDM